MSHGSHVLLLLQEADSVTMSRDSHMLLQRERDNELKRQQQEQELRIAAEMQKMKLNQLRDEKMRQQIRETRYIQTVHVYFRGTLSFTYLLDISFKFSIVFNTIFFNVLKLFYYVYDFFS